MKENIDELFKNGLNEPPIEWNEADWLAMEKVLDRKRNNTKIGYILTYISGIAAVLLIVFLWGNPAPEKNEAEKTAKKIKPAENLRIDSVQTAGHTAKVIKPSSDNGRTKDQAISSANETASAADKKEDKKTGNRRFNARIAASSQMPNENAGNLVPPFAENKAIIIDKDSVNIEKSTAGLNINQPADANLAGTSELKKNQAAENLIPDSAAVQKMASVKNKIDKSKKEKPVKKEKGKKEESDVQYL